jgi:hypothetical protein
VPKRWPLWCVSPALVGEQTQSLLEEISVINFDLLPWRELE